MPFTSLDRVKRLLRIPAGITQWDGAIGDVVEGANATILQEIGLAGMTQQSYTEILDIDAGQDRVSLRHRPVQSVVAITDGESSLVAADYYVDSEIGFIRTTNGAAFTEGRGRFQITYTAGFTAPNLPPGDLAQAATYIAAADLIAGPAAGLMREQIGSHSVQVDDSGYPKAVDRILAKYRNAYVR